MAEPIKGRKAEQVAPTPQNTPANNAPISSRAQVPGIASIKEEELDARAAASLFAQNPNLMSLMQNRLDSLVGRPSGYIESLPPKIQRRVAGLKGVQKEHAKLEAQFQEEVLELEKKYFAKFTPLYEKRAQIVNGKLEPTEEEVEAGKSPEEDEDDEEIGSANEVGERLDNSGEEAAKKIPDDAPGIPEFWLSAMKNQISLAELITDRDEAALKSLKDIRMEYLDRPGFRLIFEFDENEFFTNKTLSKTYYYQEDTGYAGDFIYDHADGDKIDWKPSQDLTIRTESKKQRNKNTKQTRIVKKTIPINSFFNFFSPPKPPVEGQTSADEPEDVEERLELDYQLGEDIKEKLIPRAIDWFTGEALQYEDFDEDDDEDIEYGDEDDYGDEASDRDEDEETEDEDDGGKPKQETQECKQS